MLLKDNTLFGTNIIEDSMFLKRFLQYNCKTEHSFQLNICLKGLTFPQYEAFQNIWQIINENEIKAPGISPSSYRCTEK